MRASGLLDAQGQAAGADDVGELCVSGSCVAQGYLDRPELTRERFVQARDDDGRPCTLFKTGDLARRRNGLIELVGRVDDMVKVRGYRVEIGEVEARVRQHPAVLDSAVVAEERDGEERVLVACVVPREGSDPSAEELRQWLDRLLPDYMIPSRFVMVAALPLSSSGKVDRAAIRTLAADAPVPAPAPTPAPAEARDGSRASTAERVMKIVAEVLGVAAVSGDDRFLALGGHSLAAMRIIARVYDDFGVDLPLESFFAPDLTVGTLAREVEHLREVQVASS